LLLLIGKISEIFEQNFHASKISELTSVRCAHIFFHAKTQSSKGAKKMYKEQSQIKAAVTLIYKIGNGRCL
jgi:hypothetical protein